MAEVITVGERKLEYNPTVEKIRTYYGNDIVLIEVMFTWDVEEAIALKKQIEMMHPDKKVIIDGVGWRNAGNEGYFDLDKLEQITCTYEPREEIIVKLSEGCPNNCDFCFSKDFKIKLPDENILAIFDFLKVPNKKEAICGFDKYRMNDAIAFLLKNSKFQDIRLAWDEPYTPNSMFKTKDAIDCLLKAGYKPKDISIFILTNWKVSFDDCCNKLDLLKVWNIKVNDCCFNCSYKNPVPDYWNLEEIKQFRKMCRKHNQIVVFGIDPELKEEKQ